eukprot:1160683-Pelagomonas_calceolata.AAC.2
MACKDYVLFLKLLAPYAQNHLPCMLSERLHASGGSKKCVGALKVQAPPPKMFYTHHYEQYMDLADFQQAAEVVTNITAQYAAANSASQAPPINRLRPHGLSFLS